MLLKKYPRLQFSILGAGIHDELADDIYHYLNLHQLTNKIKILQWGNSHTSRQFLEETDIFVMTSVFEGLPFSLLEAMAIGIPCVVSKVDGNTDVIQNNENGFACLSIKEFCNKIELLINNPYIRSQIGQAGQKYVRTHHNVQLNTKKLERIYLEL
jgi:glycosyltransferase involved in cell wall biosynthesis